MNTVAADTFVNDKSVDTAETIEFAITACDVGRVLVGRSRRGVCAILLGTNAEELKIALGEIFPGDLFIHNEQAVRDDTSKILHFLSSPNADLDIDLDIRGSSFQRKVWEALRTIPAGRPLTFAQLACRIPGSKSLRAIGQACADNPIALAIPCHRVMGNSGSLSNSRYGADCKRFLINREAAAASVSTSLHGRKSWADSKTKTTNGVFAREPHSTFCACPLELKQKHRSYYMSKESDNKTVVGRWFTEFWGETCNLNIVDELAAPDMLLQYSLHEPRRGRDDIKAFMTDFRKAFPDLNFWGAADLIAEGDYVVGRWEGGGTHTGPAFGDFLAGSLPANTGRKMKFTGTTVLKLKDGKIVEEIGLDDGVAALTQLGLIKTAA
jgi:O-6-methylguanine DNA methyltransferase